MKSSWKYALVALVIAAPALVWWQGRGGPADTQDTLPHPRSQARHDQPREAAETKRWDELTDNSIPWQARVDMLRKMKTDSLTPADGRKFVSLLSHRATTQPAEAWWCVLNELMEQMRIRGIAKDRYTDALLEVLGDNSAPEVPRDYAVQHLGQWLAPRDPSLPSERDAARAAKALETITGAMTDPRLADTSVPGTALHTLIDLRRNLKSRLAQQAQTLPSGTSATENEHSPGNFKPLMQQLEKSLAALDPWLEQVIRNGNGASLSTRTSAIAAVADLGRSQHLGLLRELAATQQSDPSLRLSAIAALGGVGTPEDLPRLEKLSQQTGPFREAAKYAYQRLKQKTSPQP